MFKSTKATIALSCCLVFVMTLFMSVGYARVLDTLTITGTVEYQKDPALVFIVDTAVSASGGNLSGDTPSVTKVDKYLRTMKNSNFTLETNGWVTIYVKVKNNSGVTQYFSGYTALDADKKDITSIGKGVEVSYSWVEETPENKDKKVLGAELPHGGEMEFYIKIENTIKDKKVSFGNRTGEVKFAPSFEDLTTETSTIAERLGKLLNNEIKIDNKTGAELLDDMFVFKNNDSGIASTSPTGDYLGNVGNATDAQKKMMETIFGDDITMKIGNTTYPVWFLIKRQEVDGQKNDKNPNNNKSGADQAQNDIVLYITIDPLATGSNSDGDYHYVPVYAIVYLYNSDGNYTQCSHMFAGEAPVCNLSGQFGTNNTGNIHTHYWRSTEFDVNNDTQDGEINEAYKYYINIVQNK